MPRRPNAADSATPQPHPSSAADPQLLEELLRDYWKPLVAYAERLLGDHAAAEDVVQRGFVRLWQREYQLPPHDEMRPFLYRMVRNLVANEWRRAANLARWQEEAAHQEEYEPSHCSHSLLEAAELERAIELAVETLPPRRREAFVLSRYHGLSNTQVAEVLGVSPQTVANQLVSSLRTLRELLRNRLDDAPAAHLRIVRSADQ
ncbi:MAG: RNA polymerase sigma-70 factor [Gemmatimonadota bacterium]